MRERILENEWFYCHHLSSMDEGDITGFEVKHPEFGQGLADYIIHLAIKDEEAGIMRTYLVRDKKTDEMVGYYSLKSGMVSLNERELADNEVVFDTLPGIELANFAVDQRYIIAHPGQFNIGLKVFRDFIRPMAIQHSVYIGTLLLYIFALPQETLISRYSERYGFRRLSGDDEDMLHRRMKPRYDRSCIFMYQMLK